MANIKSAKKRIITSRKKAVDNNAIDSARRTAIKKFEKLVNEGKKDEAKVALNTAIQKIDKALKNNLIHANKAARLKSRLTKKLNNME